MPWHPILFKHSPSLYKQTFINLPYNVKTLFFFFFFPYLLKKCLLLFHLSAKVSTRREQPAGREHSHMSRRSKTINGPIVIWQDKPLAILTGGCISYVECAILDQFSNPWFLLGALVSTCHLLTQVFFHGMNALLEHFQWWWNQRVTFNTKLLELLETTNGVRQIGDLVVANIQFNEGK